MERGRTRTTRVLLISARYVVPLVQVPLVLMADVVVVLVFAHIRTVYPLRHLLLDGRV